MKNTKASAFAILHQLGLCLYDFEEAGFVPDEKGLNRIYRGDLNVKSVSPSGMADCIRNNKRFRKAIFRMNVIQETGLLDMAKKVLIQEGVAVKKGRTLVVKFHILTVLMVALIDVIMLFAMGMDVRTEPFEVGIFVIISSMVYGMSLMLLNYTIGDNTVITEYGEATEEFTDQLMNETLYDHGKPSLVTSVYSTDNWAKVSEGAEWLDEPLHTILLIEYYLRIFNSPIMRRCFKGETPVDVYNREYCQIERELIHYYRLDPTDITRKPKRKTTTERRDRNKHKGDRKPQIYNMY